MRFLLLVGVSVAAAQVESTGFVPEPAYLPAREVGGDFYFTAARLGGALLVDPDGTPTVANAGHLPPYVDGREAELDGGFPLGVSLGADYGESVLRGGAFTFVSDGVVEAANAQAELFGFDRTSDFSTEPVAEIAEAVRAWGQNDDITVVTVNSSVRRNR